MELMPEKNQNYVALIADLVASRALTPKATGAAMRG